MKFKTKTKLWATSIGVLTIVAGISAVATSCYNVKDNNQRLYQLAFIPNNNDKFNPIYQLVVFIPKTIDPISKQVLLTPEQVKNAVFKVAGENISRTTNEQENYLLSDMLFDLHRDGENFYRVYLQLPVKTNLTVGQTYTVTSNIQGYEKIAHFQIQKNDFDNVVDLKTLLDNYKNLENIDKDVQKLESVLESYNNFNNLMFKYFRSYDNLIDENYEFNSKQKEFLEVYSTTKKEVRALSAKNYNVWSLDIKLKNAWFKMRSVFNNDRDIKPWFDALEKFSSGIEKAQTDVADFNQLAKLKSQAVDEQSKENYNNVIRQVYASFGFENIEDKYLKTMIEKTFVLLNA
ncbi:hypothetical protein OF377_01860 [Ureaplasma sp. ES3154-GEN]|uniref:Vmc-like lipoprotein signal peptide domain-containing protein n=1 Tax=Ureaplasma sp. ES3154-GEN TaxID=2984844 RepID=UPI0021E72304|nr:hypothetical protein [Ureaplasma sp. ES3154-GEN]MCV3743632.1 hypothetical protein [Ureaplasma sp. ES3154-GEN]